MSSELTRKTGEEYHQLQRIESRLREVSGLDAKAAGWLGSTRDAFEHLRAHLMKLYALEESQGCLPAVTQRRPELSREVQQFCGEHRSNMAKADEIMLNLRAANSADSRSADTYRRQISGFLTQLQRHEAAESELVQSVFGDDISVND